MSLKSFSYSSRPEHEYSLENSKNLFIIRFKSFVEPLDLFIKSQYLTNFRELITLKDAFRESKVFIYAIRSEVSEAIRDEIKAIIRKYHSNQIEYIGSVKVFEGTNIYQIYTGNIFLKFRENVSEKVINFIIQKHKLKIKNILNFSVNTFFCEPHDDLGSDIFDTSLEILSNDEVEYCHPELVVKSRSMPESVDYRKFDGEKNHWVFEKTNVFEAWKFSKGKGIRVCVIDDGIDFSHPSFGAKGKIAKSRDMHDKLGKRLPQHLFDDKHGTAVSSIVVSADDQALGIAPDAQLIPIRATSLGSVLQSEAFYWAIEADSDIIVCSWGPPDGDFSNPLDNQIEYPIPPHTDLAIKYASKHGRKGKGSIIVFAAGNGNEPMSFDKYASHPEVLGIGAINSKNQPAIYSDFGYSMFCCFPSGDYDFASGKYKKTKNSITVLDATGKSGYSDDRYFQYFDGTSAACPGVAGIIALMLSANPNLTKSQTIEILKNSCEKIGNTDEYNNPEGKSKRFGFGLIQADKAVLNAIKLLNIKNMKAVSLHIGINFVDSSYYGQIVPELSGCITDLENMKSFAESLGYTSATLANEEATQKRITDEIIRLGNLAGSEGIFLISYSGHGAPLSEDEGITNDFEETGKDQAWVTYDGFLVDDRINESLSRLPEGLRVLVVSDSCFSGSITKAFLGATEFNTKRSITFDQVRLVLDRNNQTLEEIKAPFDGKAKASILLLSACTDNQFAYESNKEGLFTVELLKTYRELISTQKTNINYETFKDIILKKIGGQQQPQIKITGKDDVIFKNQFPFSIDGIPTTQSNNQTQASPSPTSPNPQKSQGFKSILVHKSDDLGTVIPINPDVPSNFQQFGLKGIDSRSIGLSTEWDKAYQLSINNNTFIEPDNASNLFYPLETDDSSRSPAEYLDTYPNPEKYGSPNRFIWHLDDEHSQLLRAREMVYTGINIGMKPDFEDQVRIGHIDTGYFPDSPILPENLQKGLSVHFKAGQSYEGATDYPDVYPLGIGEQDGHGNATLALLAGGKVEMSGLYEGYFGAIPFAKVISMKISETVALLSGKNFASAVDYAIANHCDVITMSMAGFPTKVMADAVNRAYNAGIVIVSAASNSFSQGIGSVLPKVSLYPARFDRVIGAVGAAVNKVPYLIDAQKKARAAGGRYMQTCYGPPEALHTSLAAFTPNITWFNGDFNRKQPLWVFTGGGTSSATPQIAAAAALYIQKYKTELSAFTGTEKWKKAEIVRQALFRSADKSTPYNYVYGNGLLRAADALGEDYTPDKMLVFVEKPASPAEVSGGIFNRLFRIFTNRALVQNTNIEEMLGVELFQLLHRDPKLNKYLESIPTTVDITKLKDFDLSQLIVDVKESKLASEFLKRSLINVSVGNSAKSFTRATPTTSNFNTFKIDGSKGSYFITSEGISCQIINTALDAAIAQNLWVDEVSIELTSLPSRGNSAESLLIVNDDTNLQTAVLVEQEIEGHKYFEWCFPSETEPNTAKTRSFQSLSIDGSTKISFKLDSSDSSKGIGSGAKKIFLKIFKWIKPNLPTKLLKNNTDSLLSSLGDSKYELLEFELASQSWVPFNPKTSSNDAILVLPGLFGTVENGFTEYFSNPKVQTHIKNRKVIGFNMPTAIHGIAENAKRLNDELTKPENSIKVSTILTRSRGGIVARYLLEALKFPNVKNLIMVGPPNEGTQMASSQNWSKLLNSATNLANLAFGSYVPILPAISTILKALANKFVDLPGINDLEIKSAVISSLNSGIAQQPNYYVVISNFTPDTWLKKVFDSFAVDNLIFQKNPNDTVVPSAGAVFKLDDNSNSTILPNNMLIIGTADSVNHFSYLKTENTNIIDWITPKI